MSLVPCSIIGIVGGGQLGRMMALAAAELGYRVHILTDLEDSPASHVSYKTTVAKYTDSESIKTFVQSVDVVTFEFENIPVKILDMMAGYRLIHPSSKVLHVTQNRVREKEFIRTQGIQTAEFRPINSYDALTSAVKELGFPCIYKTAELGYDGKGQMRITVESDLQKIWETYQHQSGILEACVPFIKEVSVIVCRNSINEVQYFPIAENRHDQGILVETIVPARIEKKLELQAQQIAVTLAAALDLVGTLAVELFVDQDSRLLVNELAPRPHNSGHYTIDACVTSQFEQHIRAICGLPLGDVSLHTSAKMINLIGKGIEDWQYYMINPRAKIHIYGKTEAKDGRKMGHVTILGD